MKLNWPLIVVLAPMAVGSLGQIHPVHRRQVEALPAGITLPRMNDILLWWDATSLTSSPVATWTDKIQGFTWVQSTNAQRPTWTTNAGVSFASASKQFLLNSQDLGNYVYPGTASGECTWLVVSKWATVASSLDLFGDQVAGGRICLGLNSPTAWYGSSGNVNCTLTANNTFDLLLSRISGLWTDRTNNVQFSTNHIGSGSTLNQFSMVGMAHTSGTVNQSHPWNGTLYEFIVWTNSFDWTESDYTQIHKYVTNKWGFTP